MPYRAKDNLPFGQEWNTEANLGSGWPPIRWAVEVLKSPFTMCVEFPYANVSGVEVTPDRARAFGADLARALGRFLREDEKAMKGQQ